MNTASRYGLGCNCQNLIPVLGARSMGAITDIVTIGGNQYSINQILDKNIIATRDTQTYSRPGGTKKSIVKAGQSIGQVYSYIKASSASSPDGRTWFQFDNGYLDYFFVPDEAVTATGLKDQGVMTVAEQVKAEADEKARIEDPIGYYVSKWLPRVLVIGGIIYLAGTYGKEFIKDKVLKKAA